jgi:hypothetical protein
LKTTLAIIVFLFLGNFSFAQITLIDSCETRQQWCSSSFRIYSDSTFFDRFGCERHQGIRIGHYRTEFDTTYLKMVEFTYENFVDSIVFIVDTLNTNEIDIFGVCRDGEYVTSEYDRLTQLDSAKLWSVINDYYGVRGEFEGIEKFSRSYDNFMKGNRFDSSDPYYFSQTFLVNVDCELGLILRDLNIWTGINEVIEVPKNTREVYVYYSFGSSIMHEIRSIGVPIQKKRTTNIIECKGRLFKYE